MSAAYQQLADLIGATADRHLTTSIVTAVDTASKHVGISNWWAAHRWPECHSADAPEPQAFAFRARWAVLNTSTGSGIAPSLTLRPDGINEAYRARDVAGSTIRPDLPAKDEPLYATPHEAAGHLATSAFPGTPDDAHDMGQSSFQLSDDA